MNDAPVPVVRNENFAIGDAGLHARRFDLAPGERWYVAMTLPRKERVAVANLDNQGFRSFLPLQIATHRHARQFRTELVPAFTRYVFVILDIDRQRWRSVNGTVGVARLLSDGQRPIVIRPGIVETLVQSSDGRGALQFQPELAVGDRLRLVSGPFAESFGVLQRLDGTRRVQLLLDVIGGSLKLSVEREAVTLA